MQSERSPRVIVTGIGMMTALGRNARETWDNLLQGRSGVGRITSFDALGSPVQWGVEVPRFDLRPLLRAPKNLKLMDWRTRFAVAAATEAAESAGLFRSAVDPGRMGTILNSGTTPLFEAELLEALSRVPAAERCIEKLSMHWMANLNPLYQLKYLPNMPTAHIGIELGAGGPSSTTVFDCFGALQAIDQGARWIEEGRADLVIAGGTDSRINPFDIVALSSHDNLLATTDPLNFRGPFDCDRAGFLPGEGAAILILESLAHAEERGAPPLAEVAGFAMFPDPSDPLKPAAEGLAQGEAIAECLAQGGAEPADLSAVFAGGLATRAHDRSEAAALQRTIPTAIPVTASKGALGNTFAAAAAIDSCLAVQSISTGLIPPVVALSRADPDCSLNCVQESPLQASCQKVLVTARSLSGLTGALLLQRPASGNR